MAERIGYLIKRAQQSVRLALDAALQGLPLTTAQYAALSALETTTNLSNAALARACFVTPQTMIEILQGLESAGFVVRQRHPAHGRILQTALTERGRSVLTGAHAAAAAVEARMLSGFEPEEQVQIAELLVRCCNNLDSTAL